MQNYVARTSVEICTNGVDVISSKHLNITDKNTSDLVR